MDKTATKRDPPRDQEDLQGHPVQGHPERDPQTAKQGPTTAKLFMHGRSQAVRLPKEFRFAGKEVRIRRDGVRVILEPMKFDVQAWFRRIDACGDGPFLEEGIDDPPPVTPERIFDE